MGELRDMVGYKAGRPDARRAGRTTGPDARHFHIKDVLAQVAHESSSTYMTGTIGDVTNNLRSFSSLGLLINGLRRQPPNWVSSVKLEAHLGSSKW